MKNRKFTEKEKFEIVTNEMISRINLIKYIAEVLEKKQGKKVADDYREVFGTMICNMQNELLFRQLFGIGKVKGCVKVIK